MTSFLSDVHGNFSIPYQQLAADLQSGQTVVEEGSESQRLYRQLVVWLGQVVRGTPQVAWPNDGQGAAAKALSPLAPAALDSVIREVDFHNMPADLNAWRNLFLGSPSRILIETSGSSGKPKQVWHTVKTLTRGVRISPKHRSDIWGLAYPGDHLAGMQVLFQALLNANPLVHLYRANANDVHFALDHYSITHLSCTPTFLRMTLGDNHVHPKLIRLTTGGERLDRQLISRVAKVFPKARLTNIYASTEVGSLLVSHDDGFEIPNELIDKIRIIDGELWFHRRLRVDQDTADSTVSDDTTDDFWPTGDQVEVVAEKPLVIRFVSRNHEGFNVAGYRVDPVRLEAIARSHPQVVDARFYGVPNSVTEHLVACDLVAAEGADPIEAVQWQAWMRSHVARHEVPRVVRWVPVLETTNSGKVKRN